MSRPSSGRTRAVVLACALVSTLGVAHAGGPSTVAYTQRFPLQQGSYTRNVSLPPFDTNLGHLVGVSFQAQFFTRWFLQVENTASSGASVQVQLSLMSQAQCTLQGAPVAGPPQLLVQSINLGPSDGVLDFAGISGERLQSSSFPSEILVGTSSLPLTVSTAFQGDAWIPFVVLTAANVSQTGLSVGQFESSVESAVAITLVYTYDSAPSDCNSNGIPDRIEVCSLGVPDVNHNGIPDGCEVGEMADCNANGVTDATDIASGTSLDLDANGIPDECNLDCDDDGILDACDTPCPSATGGDDCNHNGLPDDYDVFHDPSLDANGNGMIDACEGSLQLVDCACQTSLYGSAVPDAHGFAPRIGFSGTGRVSDGDFALVARDCPPNRPGMFVAGTEPDSAPFGLGTRLVGGALRRFPAITSDASGVARRPIDLAAPSNGITPHVPVHFQLVYRASSPQGPTVNVSDALAMTFCP